MTSRTVYVVNPDDFSIHERIRWIGENSAGAITVDTKPGRTEYVSVDRWAATRSEARQKALILLDIRVAALQREIVALEAQKRTL